MWVSKLKGNLIISGTDYINNSAAEKGVEVYPNPTDEPIQAIIHNYEGVIYIELYSNTGQQLYTQKHQVINNEPFEIPINQLPSGTYYIRFMDENGGAIRSEKIIVK